MKSLSPLYSCFLYVVVIGVSMVACTESNYPTSLPSIEPTYSPMDQAPSAMVYVPSKAPTNSPIKSAPTTPVQGSPTVTIPVNVPITTPVGTPPSIPVQGSPTVTIPVNTPVTSPVGKAPSSPVQGSPTAPIPVNTPIFVPVGQSPVNVVGNRSDTCASNENCDSLGLTGKCCPTTDGIFLVCCGDASCALNDACDALGLTGLCCPTAENQYLACCGGVVEETCQKNPKCDALGLTGACCPTSGNRRPKLNGIFLDCCETVPDECEIERQSKRTGGGGTSNDTEVTPPLACEQMTAVEYKLELESAAATDSGSVPSYQQGNVIATSMMIALSSIFAVALIG